MEGDAVAKTVDSGRLGVTNTTEGPGVVVAMSAGVVVVEVVVVDVRDACVFRVSPNRGCVKRVAHQ